MIKRGNDPRTTEEKRQDKQVQEAIQDGTFTLLSQEERRQSIARARMKKEARRMAERIGLNLAGLRRDANLTQEQLARRIGTQRTAISRLESGRYGGLTIERFLLIMEAISNASEVTPRNPTERTRGRSYYGFDRVPDTIVSFEGESQI